MADQPLYTNNNKRKYDDHPPLFGFSDVLSYNNAPPPLDEIRIAKQKPQEIAARWLNSGDVKRLKFDDDTYNDSRDYNEPKDHNVVHGKPLFDILSKLPSKSLLRFRCVSKLWRELIADSYFVSVHDKQVIEEPTLMMFYSKFTSKADTLCFHTIESDTITNHVLKAKNKVPVFEFEVNNLPYETCYTKFLGSCNGLVLIENRDKSDYDMPTYTVIHPINKQFYVLPKLPYTCDEQVSFGLGFDSSTNTFKMLCVYGNPNPPFDYWNIVHVFGTNTWRYIPAAPSYDISYGGAIYSNGCLHWLVDYEFGRDGTQHVIWFDVKNEEFGLIRPPKTKSKPTKREYNSLSSDHLVDLDGQVGYFVDETTQVWVLNHKKEWVLHCDFEDNDFPEGFIEVLGCLNKAGDILIKLTKCWIQKKCFFYIYNLKNRVMHKARIDGLDLENGCKTSFVMFPNSLCDIITNSNLFKKELEENMEHLWQR